VALVLGVVFLNEPITAGLVIGFPLILIGSWFAGKRHEVKQKKQKNTPEVGTETTELDVLPKG
jgi:drug/metabolite transporter (DMT)-like permease